jgi:hypothetical protein
MRRVRVTKEKLYSEERKRERAPEITKRWAGQLTTMEKQNGNREKKETVCSSNPTFWGGVWGGVWGG